MNSEEIADSIELVSDSIERAFISPTASAVSRGPDNIVSAISGAASAIQQVADSIFPPNTMGGQDASGGHVNSVVEAILGITAGLYAVAAAIEKVADCMEKP